MVIVAALATATACSASDSSEPAPVTVTEIAASDTQAVGDEKGADAADAAQPAAAPATFDRNDPNFEFFNICEELTDEDLAEVGLKFADVDRTILLERPFVSCGFDELESDGMIVDRNMIFSGVSAAELHEAADFIELTTPSALDGAQTFVLKDEPNEWDCDAAVPTSRGLLWVNFAIFREGVLTREESCGQTVEYLERIHKVVEKKL